MLAGADGTIGRDLPAAVVARRRITHHDAIDIDADDAADRRRAGDESLPSWKATASTVTSGFGPEAVPSEGWGVCSTLVAPPDRRHTTRGLLPGFSER